MFHVPILYICFVFLYVSIYIDGVEERLFPVTINYLENGSKVYAKNILVVDYYHSINVDTDNPGTCMTFNCIMGMSAISVQQSRAQDW